MTQKQISTWRPGDDVAAYVYLTMPEVTGTGKGRRRTATASDSSGSIAVVDFGNVLATVVDRGFHAVRGSVSTYNGTIQLMPLVVRPVTEDDRAYGFDEAACVLSAPVSADLMISTLAGYAETLDSAMAKAIWIETPHRYPGLYTWPAAKSVHHAYRGGLLYHVLGMLALGKVVAVQYTLDWDALALGILYHDIGKIKELGEYPGDPYTFQGNAVGHIHLSTEMWAETCDHFGIVLNDPLRNHVLHLILSHHGALEHGSPVKPITGEALALHHVDMLDSRLEILRAGTKDVEPGQVVQCWPLDKLTSAWPKPVTGGDHESDRHDSWRDQD